MMIIRVGMKITRENYNIAHFNDKEETVEWA
jgi:hypothetical protein